MAHSLTSRRLLALLFICECKRKGKDLSLENATSTAEWNGYLEMFSNRFSNLGETLRFEVLEAHIMSVEDVDIYNDETLRGLLVENRAVLDVLTDKLEQILSFRSKRDINPIYRR